MTWFTTTIEKILPQISRLLLGFRYEIFQLHCIMGLVTLGD